MGQLGKSKKKDLRPRQYFKSMRISKKHSDPDSLFL